MIRNNAISALLGIFLPVAALAQQSGSAMETVVVPPSYCLTKGYVTEVSLNRFEEQAVNQVNSYACSLVADDTLTVNVKLLSFAFEQGIGDPFPTYETSVNISLSRMEDEIAEPLCSLPFMVCIHGDTVTTSISSHYERQDSVILTLYPGEYYLEYGGFDRMRLPLLSSPPQEGTPVDEIPELSTEEAMTTLSHSIINLALECIPLYEEDVLPPTTWNKVTTSVSLNGDVQQDSLMTTIEWLDDFGRSTSSHRLSFNPDRSTLVTMMDYDACGRAVREWLPCTLPQRSGKNDYHLSADNFRLFSIACNLQDEAPYSEVIHERIPEERPVREFGPGAQWRTADRAVGTEYGCNGDDPRLRCRMISVSSQDTSFVISSNGCYMPGTLKATIRRDEQHREIIEFSDRLGRKILSRQVVDGTSDGQPCQQYMDTYYAYDGIDRVAAIIPPALSAMFSDGPLSMLLSAGIDRYAYLYLYDARERVCACKLPGAAWTRTVYDKAGRAVFTQNGEQRHMDESCFAVYDVTGRECVRGICSRDITTGEMIEDFVIAEYRGPGGQLAGYDFSGTAIPSPQISDANYYDSYAFAQDFGTGLPSRGLRWGQDVPSTEGLFTGSLHHPLMEQVDNSTSIWNLVRYDLRGRAAHTEIGYSAGGGYDIEDIDLNFTGKPVHRHLEHRYSASGSVVTEDISYTYDHAGRLLETRHSLDGAPSVLLASNGYDSLGRLSAVHRGAATSLPSSYSYNIRSWVTEIGGPLFSETIHYNDASADAPRYDGSVAAIRWRTSQEGSYQTYKFLYDDLGRLTEADYSMIVRNGLNTTVRKEYCAAYSYDTMGNVLTLTRGGTSSFEVVDNLSMTYDGNRLVSVSDTASGLTLEGATAGFRDGATLETEFSYDADGRMTSDANRGISSIIYNAAGYPVRISSSTSDQTFTYLSDGTKLCRIVSTGTSADTTAYRGGLVYVNGALKYIRTGNGVVEMSEQTPKYRFYLTDHLGSNRVVAGASGSVVQTNDFFPFGMKFGSTHKDPSSTIPGHVPDFPILATSSEQPWKFCDKELQSDTWCDVYDFHARLYDPEAIRFLSMDPKAADYPDISPYAYCGNDPVNNIDPDGREKISMMIHPPHQKDFKYRGSTNSHMDFKTDLAEFRRTSQLIGDINNAPDYDNLLLLYAHGTADGQGISIYDERNTKINYVKRVDKFVNGELDSSQVIQSNNENGKGSVIVLNCCNTGNGKDSFGAKLSKAMSSSIIIAPTKKVNAVGNSVGNDGKWNIFKNGKIVDGFNANENDFSNMLGQINKDPQKFIEQYE